MIHPLEVVRNPRRNTTLRTKKRQEEREEQKAKEGMRTRHKKKDTPTHASYAVLVFSST